LAISGCRPDTGWPWSAIMSSWRSTEARQLSTGGRTITRRVLLLAVMLAPVAACGKRGALELPQPGDDDEEE
jgi:hypothetical protein